MNTLVPHRNLAIGLLVCAVLVLVGTLSKSWVTGGNKHLGPLGAEVCRDSGPCTAKELHLAGDLQVTKILSLLGGLASAAAAAVYGGGLLANKREKLPTAKLAQTVFGVAAFGMTLFLFRCMAQSGTSLDWPGIAALAGVLTGSVLLRQATKTPAVDSGKLAPWTP